MKKYLLLFFILYCSVVQGQNLVPNPSFETLISCPDAQGQYFYSYTPPWFSPNINTPDIWNACAINVFLQVPNTGIGYQQAHTGNGFGGFGRYFNSNTSDGLSVKLISPMITGKKYCISFFVNPGNYTGMFTDAIGAYISIDSIHINNFDILPFIPQIENPLGVGYIISDTVNWTEISGEYIANGGEQFINIGSFYDNSLIHWAYNDTIHNGLYPYYFLDDVSITLCDTTGINEMENNQSLITISPNPTNNNFTIENNTIFKMTNCKIYNSIGSLVFEKKQIENKENIDVSDFLPGIYFLEMMVNEKMVMKKLIIY